jgi:hypothetical protein
MKKIDYMYIANKYHNELHKFEIKVLFVLFLYFCIIFMIFKQSIIC